MAPREDIILLGVVSVFDVISAEVKKKLAVGIRKLLNKSQESVKKGLEIVKSMVGSNGTLANSTFVNNTLINYIRENPVKSAGYVSAVTLLASAGVFAFNYARNLIRRYNEADDKAYKAMKVATKYNPNINPSLYYLGALVHFFVRSSGASVKGDENPIYRVKPRPPLVNQHRNPPPVVEDQIPRGTQWRYLPLTALATGILGYGAAKLGQLSYNQRIANNNYWNTYLTANNNFLSDQERQHALNSIDY